MKTKTTALGFAVLCALVVPLSGQNTTSGATETNTPAPGEFTASAADTNSPMPAPVEKPTNSVEPAPEPMTPEPAIAAPMPNQGMSESGGGGFDTMPGPMPRQSVKETPTNNVEMFQDSVKRLR